MWFSVGYYAEARSWEEQATEAAGGASTNEFARCLRALGVVYGSQGDYQRARDLLARSVAMYRQLGNDEQLPRTLTQLAIAHQKLGQLAAARADYNEAITILREKGDHGDQGDLGMALANLGVLEHVEGNHEQALTLLDESRTLLREDGDEVSVLWANFSVADSLWKLGRVDEAHQLMAQHLPELVRLAEPDLLMAVGEQVAELLADREHIHWAVRIFAAVEAMRQRNGVPRPPENDVDFAESVAKARVAITAQAWDYEYEVGANMTVEDALTQAHATTADMAG